jgi:hypothetical protein
MVVMTLAALFTLTARADWQWVEVGTVENDISQDEITTVWATEDCESSVTRPELTFITRVRLSRSPRDQGREEKSGPLQGKRCAEPVINEPRSGISSVL